MSIIHVHGCQCTAAACINVVIEMKRHVLEQTKVCGCRACLIAVPNERGESKTIGCMRHQEWIGR